MIDWVSLIPAGVSLLSGLFGGNSTKNKNDSSVDKSVSKILTEAGKVYSEPYQSYTGTRVAPSTESRTQLTPLMNQLGTTVTNQLNDTGGLQARAKQLLNIGPQRVSVPTMVSNGPSVSMNASPTVTPLVA